MPAMHKVETIDPIKDNRWDQFVYKHPYGWIVHLSGWKKVLEKTFPHMKGHYFVLTGTADGEIKAALPVFEVNSWLLGRRLVSIPFATLCDPLISRDTDIGSLLDKLFDLSRNRKTSVIEIRSLQSPSLIHDSRLTESRIYRHHFIKLDRPIEELKMTLHRKSVRQEIRRAEKNQLALRMAVTESDLQSFYSIYLKARKRLQLPAQPYALFKSLWDEFHKANQMRLLFAEKEGVIISGLIVLTFKDRCSAEYIGTDYTYRDVSPDHFLFWQAIQMAHCEGFKIFDFGRTAAADQSHMIFKSRWGTEVIDLPQYYYPPKSADLSSNTETSLKYRLIRKVCHHAPDALFPYIGNFCYRHMG